MSWDGLIEIFNPGHRHLADERDRKRVEAQIPGSESGDDTVSYVDLDRGIVHLAVPAERLGPVVPTAPRAADDADEAEDAEAAEDAEDADE